MTRRHLRQAVETALGDRQLIWFGLRGDEAEAMGDLRQFAAAFSNIARYDRRTLPVALAYEDLTGRRPDMDTWDLDLNPQNPATARFRAAALTAMARPCAVVPYRPSDFLSSLAFARQTQCLYLGVFGAQQKAFEHKPWVESELRRAGVPSIPWAYVADEDKDRAYRLLRSGPIVLRRSRGSGGEGTAYVEDEAGLDQAWAVGGDTFLAVAPYLANHTPVNIGATVWNDRVTLHAPSLQIIGVAELTRRRFGYCGNDFAQAKTLDPDVWRQVESLTTRTGCWLQANGYRGSFGVDYLVSPTGQVLFTELNPRFQGSTSLSCKLSWAVDEPDLILEHMAACLGLDGPPAGPALPERMDAWPGMAHAVAHWVGTTPLAVDNTSALSEALMRAIPGSTVDLRPPDRSVLEPEGVLLHVTVPGTLIAGAEPMSSLIRLLSADAADRTHRKGVTCPA
ncbi:MAG: ATP-grasp domain-containing protein [Propionibacteriaceae bacterium]|jgi:hypothetical protein|nr:ATP-grasp domain-containing protein [Propionibacteriaceae bacterium]